MTTAASGLVRPINDRMPVIVANEDYGRWLAPEFFDLQQLERMMQSLPPDQMVVAPGRS